MIFYSNKFTFAYFCFISTVLSSLWLQPFTWAWFLLLNNPVKEWKITKCQNYHILAIFVIHLILRNGKFPVFIIKFVLKSFCQINELCPNFCDITQNWTWYYFIQFSDTMNQNTWTKIILMTIIIMRYLGHCFLNVLSFCCCCC